MPEYVEVYIREGGGTYYKPAGGGIYYGFGGSPSRGVIYDFLTGVGEHQYFGAPRASFETVVPESVWYLDENGEVYMMEDV